MKAAFNSFGSLAGGMPSSLCSDTRGGASSSSRCGGIAAVSPSTALPMHAVFHVSAEEKEGEGDMAKGARNAFPFSAEEVPPAASCHEAHPTSLPSSGGLGIEKEAAEEEGRPWGSTVGASFMISSSFGILAPFCRTGGARHHASDPPLAQSEGDEEETFTEERAASCIPAAPAEDHAKWW